MMAMMGVSTPAQESTSPDRTLEIAPVVDALPEADEGESGITNVVPLDRSWRFARGTSEFGYEIGFAPTQPTFFSRKEYDTSGRKLALNSVRFGRFIGTRNGVTYQYIFEAIPFTLAINNEVGSSSKTSRRQATAGFGVQPLGLRLLLRPNSRLKPFVQAGGGLMFSGKPIPVPESTRLNFTGDFGGGVMYRLSESKSISMGYRYFHISNMYLSQTNPGYNASVLYFGYSFFKR